MLSLKKDITQPEPEKISENQEELKKENESSTEYYLISFLLLALTFSAALMIKRKK